MAYTGQDPVTWPMIVQASVLAGSSRPLTPAPTPPSWVPGFSAFTE